MTSYTSLASVLAGLFCEDVEDGIYEHPFDCTQYIQCVGDEEFVTQCPSCLVFDTTINVSVQKTYHRQHFGCKVEN